MGGEVTPYKYAPKIENSFTSSKNINQNSFLSKNTGQKCLSVLGAITTIYGAFSSISDYKNSMNENKFWTCLPSEADHEKQLAEERRKKKEWRYFLS
jgi:hypothetical protein